jgi:futalosine hydrolase
MNVVLIAATENEIGITASLNLVDVLTTGVGSTATAYALTKYVVENKPDLIIQAGIAGSFNADIRPGTVGFIKEEIFADLGAIENNELTDIFDLGLAGMSEPPFTNKWLKNPLLDSWKKFNLPLFTSATVNRISSGQIEVERIKAKYNPDIESMEGAALHYVCLKENVPFIQIRAISNYCGERNKNNWKLKESIINLNEVLKKIITEL